MTWLTKNAMFERDPIWRAFTCGKSLEDFVAAHPPFVLRPEVPPKICEHLADIHALLLHSYCRYRFLDIAHVRAMQVVEMALRIRHQEFGSPELETGRNKGKQRRAPSLRKLLDWAERTGLIEDTDNLPSWRHFDKRPIDVLRDLRNYAVHPNPETLHGVSVVGLLYRAVDFVNELYDDIDIRKRRHTLEREIQQTLSKVTAQGAILTLNGIRLIIFHAEILYAEPIEDSWHLHLGFLKIFPPQPDEKGNYSLPDPILLCFGECVVMDDNIRFTAQDSRQASLCPITDPENKEKFQAFIADYSQHAILRPAVFQPLADMRINLKRYRKPPSEGESED